MRKSTFVPLLSTQAGSCLTMANWQEAGIVTVSLQLEQLLMKPGLAVLQACENLRSWCGWSGTLVLNALFTSSGQQDEYCIRSQYDGSIIRLSREKLFELIVHLNPDKLILPAGTASFAGQYLPASIMPYFAMDEVLPADDNRYGRYLIGKDHSSLSSATRDQQLYLVGDFAARDLQQLAGNNYLLESDKPAADGMNGIVYHQNSASSDVSANAWSTQYQLIDDNCQCNTCLQGLSRAYLHHLLQHTPLLCQRFLIQHNIHVCTSFT